MIMKNSSIVNDQAFLYGDTLTTRFLIGISEVDAFLLFEDNDLGLLKANSCKSDTNDNKV